MSANASKYEKAFKNLYQEMGIYEVPLHERCLKAAECWRRARDRYQEGEKSFISAPWVGDKYPGVGLLFLGTNLNDFGGFGAIEQNIHYWASKRNKTNIFRWAPILGAIVLERLGKMRMSKEDTDYKKIPQETVRTVYNYIAFTNIIKCSPKPKGDRSKPTRYMWPNCASHILSKELMILEPKYVICLSAYGVGYVINSALEGREFRQTTKDKWFQVFENQSDGFPRWVVGSYHPAYQRYLSYIERILDSFKNHPFEF